MYKKESEPYFALFNKTLDYQRSNYTLCNPTLSVTYCLNSLLSELNVFGLIKNNKKMLFHHSKTLFPRFEIRSNQICKAKQQNGTLDLNASQTLVDAVVDKGFSYQTCNRCKSSWVDFTNILCTAFTHKDPKCTKNTV